MLPSEELARLVHHTLIDTTLGEINANIVPGAG